ncbi:FtsX-like permease family protein [Microbacterium sp. gxy059]|uniref:FtsX-like permease family protein n=1 Tax=Microbacterium sp. gxy059 TaxID=2957199 RepID=UPI003D955A48
MTATATRASARAGRSRRSEPSESGSRRARWRLAALLALRQIRRARAASLLVIALVALPIAGTAAALIYAQSQQPTIDEDIVDTLGRADVALEVVGGPDPTRRQYFDQPYWAEVATDDDGYPLNEELPPRADIEEILPDVDLIETAYAQVIARTDKGVGTLPVEVGRTWDPLLEGRYRVLEGRTPETVHEAMATPAALERLGIEIGGTAVLTDPELELTIVGTMGTRWTNEHDMTLFVPDGTVEVENDDPMLKRWFVADDWRPTPAEIDALNEEGVVVSDRDLMRDPGERASPDFDQGSGTDWAMFSVVVAAFVFSLYIVLLLAGSAFAVSARRQRQALAVAASVGADRADLRRIVLWQGTLLGLVGGLVGAVAGIGLGALVCEIMRQRGSLIWGLHIPWLLIAALVVLAAVVGTLTALLPARSAAKMNVLAALRGARRPVAMTAKRPVWGIALIIWGIAITVASGILLVVTYRSSADLRAESDLLVTGMIGMMAGPLFSQIGVILAGHAVLALMSRLTSRWGVAARIAGRDAVANPSRIVPAFGAIAACAFLATASFGGAAVLVADTQKAWVWEAPSGSVTASLWFADDREIVESGHGDRVVSETQAMLRDAGATETALVRIPLWPAYDETTGEPADDATETFAEVSTYEICDERDPVPDCVWADADPRMGDYSPPVVVEPDGLPLLLGDAVDDETAERFAAGGAIVDGPRWLDGDEVVLHTWLTGEVYGPGASSAEPVATQRVPADVVPRDDRQFSGSVILSPAAAERIGLATQPDRVIALFDTAVDTAFLDRLGGLADELSQQVSVDGETEIMMSRQEEPPTPGPWMWLILGATTVLVVAASTIALGLSRVERRPDDATLTAVGSSPIVRRWVSFWQGLVITGVGCVTGALAGLLPVLGALFILEGTVGRPLTVAELPWPFFATLAVGLPVVIAVAAWIIRPASPDLTRRTAIA